MLKLQYWCLKKNLNIDDKLVYLQVILSNKDFRSLNAIFIMLDNKLCLYPF